MNSTNITIPVVLETCAAIESARGIGWFEIFGGIMVLLNLWVATVFIMSDYVVSQTFKRVFSILVQVPDAQKPAAIREMARVIGFEGNEETKASDQLVWKELKLSHIFTKPTIKYGACPIVRYCGRCQCEDCLIRRKEKSRGEDCEKGNIDEIS